MMPLMESRVADSGLPAEVLDLTAEKARGLSRTARDGVCLIPYLITAFNSRGTY